MRPLPKQSEHKLLHLAYTSAVEHIFAGASPNGREKGDWITTDFGPKPSAAKAIQQGVNERKDAHQDSVILRLVARSQHILVRACSVYNQSEKRATYTRCSESSVKKAGHSNTSSDVDASIQ